jgi:hypothetical protein
MRWLRSASNSKSPPLSLPSSRRKNSTPLSAASILNWSPPHRLGNLTSIRHMRIRTSMKSPQRSNMWVRLRTTSLILISTTRDGAAYKNSLTISSDTSKKLRSRKKVLYSRGSETRSRNASLARRSWRGLPDTTTRWRSRY